MPFNSWEFLVLIAVVVPLYYGPWSRGRAWQVTTLLGGSAVFYAWEEPKLLILLSVSCLLNAIGVERILFHKSGGRDPGSGEQSQRGSSERWWLRETVGGKHAKNMNNK